MLAENLPLNRRQRRLEAKQERRKDGKTIRQEPYWLPLTGFVRLPTVLYHFPVSRSAWWQGVKDGRFPEPVKLGPNTTAWKAEDIRALIEQISEESAR